MRPTILTFLLLGACFDLSAQNLVPNPSMETYSPCPTTAGQITYATGWNYSRNAGEYLNSCSASIYADVPTNYFGFQNASTGQAYFGGLQYGSFAGSYLADLREMFYIPLTTPLTIGTTYQVSFNVNLCDNSEYEINNIGAQFCTSYNANTPLNNMAHVYSPSVISDKTNWVTISGTFVPSVAYTAVMFGNFFTDVNCTVNFVGSGIDIGYNAYYLFDDFYVGPPITLPANWMNADVQVNENVSSLHWEFTGEHVKEYHIEKAIQGEEFALIGKVPAERTSMNDTVQGVEPMILYRVRALMDDGSTHLSPVMEAKFFDADVNLLRIYPSPIKAGESFTTEWSSGTTENTRLVIYDLLGRTVYESDLGENAPGTYTRTISTQGLAPGTYWVKAGALSRKLILE